MADPVVGITNGVPTSGTGTITTLGQTLLDGAQVTQGAIADGAVAAGAAGSVSAKLRSISRDIVGGVVLQAGAAIIGAVTQSGAWVLSAGAAIIGKVGIDQTTPGTTNLVSIGTNGTVNPTTAANWGIGTATQNSASVANGQLNLGQFNTTPTTITTGNMSPLQLDNAGNLLVNIKAGASSGAVAQGSTTSGQTGGLTQAAVTTAAPSYTTAQTSPLSVTTAGGLRSDTASIAGTATATGSGVMNSGTQRVAMATDSPGIIATGTAGSASSTVLTVQGIASATPIPIGGVTVTQAASSTITRPADTTAYASGDLVANSVTAGSVVNLQFTTLARISGGSGVIIGAQIQKTSNVITNAAFRLHLFNTAPTYTSAGDNSAISTVVVASAKGYLGYIDITAMVGFSDVAWGSGAPDNSRGGIPYVATAQIIYGLLEVRGAYTPISAEVFTITVDALQD